jgi:hypothetical protein
VLAGTGSVGWERRLRFLLVNPESDTAISFPYNSYKYGR